MCVSVNLNPESNFRTLLATAQDHDATASVFAFAKGVVHGGGVWSPTAMFDYHEGVLLCFG